MHLLGPGRTPRPAEERDGVALRVLPAKVAKQLLDVALAGLFENTHDRGHVPFAIGQRLKNVGNVARNVVGRGARPKRVVPHLVTGKERTRYADDVLRKRTAAAPAHMMERVVADRSIHRGEVEAIYRVAVVAQIRRHFVKETSLGVKYNVGPVALQQVRLEEVARLARAGATQHENVVVKPGCPRVHALGALGRKEELARIGGARIHPAFNHGFSRFPRDTFALVDDVDTGPLGARAS